MKIFKINFLVLLLSLITTNISVNAQNIDWMWSKNIDNGWSFRPSTQTTDSAIICTGNKITTDVTGNIITVGTYSGSGIVFGNDTFTYGGGGCNGWYCSDIFITKHSPNGSLIWAKSAAGSGSDVVNGVTTHVYKNIFITGSFDGPDLKFSTFTLLNPNGSGKMIFWAKFDSVGNLKWAKTATMGQRCEGKDITTDRLGNIILTGYYYGTLFLGINNINYAIKSDFGQDVFVAKMDNNGNLLWARNTGNHYSNTCSCNNEYSEGLGVATDATGNIYTTGEFGDKSIVFGSYTLTNNKSTYGNFVASSRNSKNIFLVKYNSNGVLQWAERASTPFNGAYLDVSDIAIDITGNVLISGTYASDSILFGNIKLKNTCALGSCNSEAYLAKFNSNGNSVWAKSIGGLLDDNSVGVSCDANKIYFAGNIAYDGYSSESYTVILNDTFRIHNLFVLAYNYSGNPVWIKKVQIDNISGDLKGVTNDSIGNLYVTGGIPVDGGGGLADGGLAINQNVNDIKINNTTKGAYYTAKLGQCNLSKPVINPSGLNTLCFGDSITITSSNAAGNTWSTGETTRSIVVSTNDILDQSHYYYDIALGAFIDYGIFSTTISNTIGCSATTSKQINLNPHLIINAQPQNQTVNIGNTAKFIVATSNSNATYQWQQNAGTGFINLSNTGQYSGVTTDTLNINAVAFSQNNYKYRCITKLGLQSCSDTTNIALLTVLNPTGINNQISDIIFEVYPNPANTTLTINTTEKFASIKVLNTIGQTVIKSEKNKTLNISPLSKGVYFIQMLNENESVITTGKFVKE